MKKTPLQVYLDQTDVSVLNELTTRLGLTKAEAVRAAIRRYAAETLGSGDPILGLIGSMDDPSIPPDLSTRHDEYLVEGYPLRRVAEPDPEK